MAEPDPGTVEQRLGQLRLDNGGSKRDYSDPYVLVLIDGHTHPFHSELLKNTAFRGDQVAEVLFTAVKQIATQFLPDLQKCRLVARVYASLGTLDYGPAQARAATMSSKKRGSPIANLAASFSAAYPFFDFIDVWDEQDVEAKIENASKIFSIAVKDRECQHILLAAWQKPMYIRLLQPHHGSTDKVTLIEGSGVGRGIEQFALSRAPISLPTVFRAPERRDIFRIHHAQIRSGSDYLKYRHHTGTRNFNIDPSPRRRSATDQPTIPRTNPELTSSMNPNLPPRVRLPPTEMAGHIAVNKNGERLDVYMHKPSPECFALYNAYDPRPCIGYHVVPPCRNEGCAFNHADIDDETRRVMQWFCKSIPCKQASSCRRSDCAYGHVCQDNRCRLYEASAQTCKLRKLHSVDATFEEWISVGADNGASADAESSYWF